MISSVMNPKGMKTRGKCNNSIELRDKTRYCIPCFFEYMKTLLEYSDTQVDSAVVVQVSFEISAIILIATIFIVLWVLFERTKKLKELRRKLMIIEMVMHE